MSGSREIQLQAEARAKAAIAEAMARAEQMTEKADARARELIAEHHRKMEELARSRMCTTPRLSPDGETVSADGAGLEADGMDPSVLRQAVSVRAYYKAEQRGFGPGHEVDDWLAAEKELLHASPWSGRIRGVTAPEL